MKSQSRKQKIAIHILPNISRSKRNQTKIFCQVIEYSMRNFLEKSCTNLEKPFPGPFLKNQN